MARNILRCRQWMTLEVVEEAEAIIPSQIVDVLDQVVECDQK